MKHISSKDPLYTGHDIKYTDKSDQKRKLTPKIKGVLKPEPNSTVLWMRPALSLSNVLSEKAKKKKIWRNKIAEPVVLSQTKPAQVAEAIHNRMFHQGYFQNVVTFDTVYNGDRKAKYEYRITLNKPYRFETVVFPVPANDLAEKITESKQETLLGRGEIYSLETVKNERIRIDRNLKENGYIYFNPEFITIKADSVTGDHQIHAEVTVKPEIPPESRKAYTIRKVFIHDDHALDNSLTDTIRYGSYYLISQNKSLHFNALEQGIFMKPGALYAISNYMHTIRYMNELPIVRNTNIKFLPHEKSDSLDVILYLSQRKRFAYSAEFNATSARVWFSATPIAITIKEPKC
jgi:outer membrane protein assembly factor BamA